MVKWLFTLVLAVLIIGAFTPWLRKLSGYRRIPGDVDVNRNGNRYIFPIVSTIALSLFASYLFWILS